jgi:hypothetical protein
VRGEKNTRQTQQLGLYFYSQILNSTRIWRVGEWASGYPQTLTIAARSKKRRSRQRNEYEYRNFAIVVHVDQCLLSYN